MATNASTPRNPSTLNAHIFRPPPESPAFSNSSPSLNPAHSSDYFTSQQRSRKRARPDSSHGMSGGQQGASTPWSSSSTHRPTAETPSWVQCPTPSDAIYGSAGALSNSAAGVNERYHLKGGLDTPGLLASAHDEGESGGQWGGDLGRRGRGDDDGRQSWGSAPVSGPLARERNGVARLPTSPNGSPHTSQGWTGFAFGLVGKVFTFGTSVIKGFYAGAGQGYDLQQPSSPASWMRASRYGGGTPIPGSWRDDEFMGDFEQDNPTSTPPSSSTSRPPNKRRQTDKDSWVVVGTPDANDTDTTPRRKVSSTSIPRSNLAAPRPSIASRASSRRSIAPASSRRSTSYVSHTGSPAVQPLAPNNHPSTEHGGRRASLAPTRSPHTTHLHSRPSSAGRRASNDPAAGGTAAGTGSGTDLSPDVQRLLKRQHRADKSVDRTMNSMGKQLQDLIAQAQTALGTKYDVESSGGGTASELYKDGDEMTDEGFVDEEW